MKLFEAEELADLTRRVVIGDLEIVYAREEENGCIYCTVRKPQPMIEHEDRGEKKR